MQIEDRRGRIIVKLVILAILTLIFILVTRGDGVYRNFMAVDYFEFIAIFLFGYTALSVFGFLLRGTRNYLISIVLFIIALIAFLVFATWLAIRIEEIGVNDNLANNIEIIAFILVGAVCIWFDIRNFRICRMADREAASYYVRQDEQYAPATHEVSRQPSGYRDHLEWVVEKCKKIAPNYTILEGGTENGDPVFNEHGEFIDRESLSPDERYLADRVKNTQRAINEAELWNRSDMTPEERELFVSARYDLSVKDLERTIDNMYHPDYIDLTK